MHPAEATFQPCVRTTCPVLLPESETAGDRNGDFSSRESNALTTAVPAADPWRAMGAIGTGKIFANVTPV